MGSSQVVAEWTATGSGQSGAGGTTTFSPERKASAAVFSGVGPGQWEHQLMRQIKGELLAHDQAAKGEIVMGHYSKAHPPQLGMALQAAPKNQGRS